MPRSLSAVFMFLLTTVLLLSACATHKQAAPQQTSPEKRLHGTVVYRERMALPPRAVALVTLQERLPDGRMVLTAQTRVPANGRSVPLPFDLLFAHPEASRTGVYLLEARIQEGDDVLFATPEPVRVPMDDAPVTLLTRRVMPEKSMVPAPQAVTTPAQKLANGPWKLRAVDGRPAEAFVNQTEAHLLFTPQGAESGMVSGSDGCNRLAGSYSLKKTSLRFSNMAGTLMLCPLGEAQSRAFNQALHNTTTWRIKDGKLELLAGKKVLAVLENAPL